MSRSKSSSSWNVDEVAVQADRAGRCCPCPPVASARDAVVEDVRVERREDRVDVAVEAPQDRLAERLRLGDRASWSKNGDVAGPRVQQPRAGQQSAGGERAAREGRRSRSARRRAARPAAPLDVVCVGRICCLSSRQCSKPLPFSVAVLRSVSIRLSSSSFSSRFRLDLREQEVEDEAGGPRELLAAVARAPSSGCSAPRSRTPPRELDEAVADRGGEVVVAVADEPAVQDPVEDRPDRAAPVAASARSRGSPGGRLVTAHTAPPSSTPAPPRPATSVPRARRGRDPGVERRETAPRGHRGRRARRLTS